MRERDWEAKWEQGVRWHGLLTRDSLAPYQEIIFWRRRARIWRALFLLACVAVWVALRVR
jgi:hypothetical protein